jgi:hypothetical protein
MDNLKDMSNINSLSLNDLLKDTIRSGNFTIYFWYLLVTVFNLSAVKKVNTSMI